MKPIPILLGILMIVTSCSSPSYLSKPKDFKYHVKGMYFETVLESNNQIIGEIIEVKTDEIKILPVPSTGGVISISKKTIKTADIIISLTSDNPKKIGVLATISTISTGAHGFWMVLTFPINLTTSVYMAQDAAKGTYRINYPNNIQWIELSRFARFPQGIPENIDLNSIR